MTNHTHRLRSAGVLALIVLTASCGEDPTTTPDASPEPDGSVSDGYRQVEHLARPAINEALLLSEAFLAGYNATAPGFAGVPTETLNAVVGEAKTVLQALYLGACLLNGALKLAPADGVKPAGITCHAVGEGLFVENKLDGVTLTEASKNAAQAYANKVFGQFVPDVMRVDTSAASAYLTLCGDANSTPLLCGGRFLNTDVVDITFNYLLAGAAITKDAPLQFRALVSDGVTFSTDNNNNDGNLSVPDPANLQQGHPNVSNAFPYSAAPF